MQQGWWGRKWKVFCRAVSILLYRVANAKRQEWSIPEPSPYSIAASRFHVTEEILGGSPLWFWTFFLPKVMDGDG